MENFPAGASETFPSTPHKKTNSCQIGRRPARFELQVKVILGSQYVVLSEIHRKFSETQPQAMNLHARHFEYNFKRA
jgi:hypothetical protein